MNYSGIKNTLLGIYLLSFAIILLSFFRPSFLEPDIKYRFPYQKAGLTKEQAAQHLLGRFTFGVRQTDIDAVVKSGLENWFEQQLEGKLSDPEVSLRLKDYDALVMNNEQIISNFPDGNQIRKMAIKEGVVNKDDLKNGDKRDYNKEIKAYKEKNNIRDEQELYRQFINQKIIRATYGNNQLQEVLTDFWFNHFNVSITKKNCAPFIPVYERDAIRANVTGKFENLVLATAKSPAMLLYLDNFVSMGNNEEMEALNAKRIAKQARTENADTNAPSPKTNVRGLNENYAREVMELHTMGVDGGYSQQDVTEAARVLTGWTIYPFGNDGPYTQMKKAIEKIGEENLVKRGFVHEGDFLFAMNRHDTKAKTVLGKTYQGNGYEEGVTLLKTLANHAATAKFISKKLATRFVNDQPSHSLIDKMAKTFLETNGDIKLVLITMVCADEFWNKAAIREKTKSPFEYAISSLRVLHADVKLPFQINSWITKMGQKMYFYQAPTGYPDKAQYWINTGSLLNRMNFGIALAGKRIPGVAFDLGALNNNHEPESAEDALVKYAKIILPQRNLENTIQRLKPLVNDPSIGNKINEAAGKTTMDKGVNDMNNDMEMMDIAKSKKAKEGIKRQEAATLSFGDNSMLAQVVGIIIGSPEFQRK